MKKVIKLSCRSHSNSKNLHCVDFKNNFTGDRTRFYFEVSNASNNQVAKNKVIKWCNVYLINDALNKDRFNKYVFIY